METDACGSTDSAVYPLLAVSMDKVKIKPKKVVIVTKNLPFSYHKEGDEWHITRKPLGPTVSAVRLMQEDARCPFKEFVWIGALADDVPEEDQPSLTKQLRAEWGAIPVFPDAQRQEGWVSFCKGVLWPLFNSQLVTDRFNTDLWRDYKYCNELFAKTVETILADLSTKQDEVLVWIHDYHLFVLPQRLRKLGISSRLGFFSHTPFPTSEIFRILPVRDKMLQGVLGSDLIGFQTYHDCRHFLSACTRILALDSRPKGVEWAGHMVAVDIFPVGIDPEGLENVLATERVRKRIEELKKTFAGHKILVGRDRLDPIKGIPQKLLALEDLFIRFPEWQGKVVLFQVCLPPNEHKSIFQPSGSSAETQDLHSQINELVGKINGKWSTADFTPIHYLTKNLELEEICAIYAAADTAILTPLRDGMNLTSHEYVVCQKDNHGPLILSEFAGSAQSLGGAVLVNPWDIKGVSTAINEVLRMSRTEKMLKHEYNYNYIKRNTALLWGNTFLKELTKLERPTVVPLLNFEEVINSYRQGKRRLLLLDYDGTLTPIVKNPLDAMPSERLVESLERLCQDPKNQVYVISGRDRQFLQQYLGHLPIGLSCEHGLFFRPYGKDQEWEDVLSGLDLTWKDVIRPILQDYTDRTPGSVIETKEVNLTWHYRNAEYDFASFQAKELVVHLQNVASKLPIEVLLGKMAIEIRPQNVNKGATVRKILAASTDADFVLCIGDDRTDEDMFVALHKIDQHHDQDEYEDEDDVEGEGEGPRTGTKKASRLSPAGKGGATADEQQQQPRHAVFTCVVNTQDSAASHWIRSQGDVVKLLKDLAAVSSGGKKLRSSEPSIDGKPPLEKQDSALMT